MEAKVQFLCAIIIFLGLISQGSCLCSVKNIEIKQEATGSKVGGKQEWRVNVKNNCACSQQDVKLDCKGFQTTETPDSKYLTVDGALCLVSEQAQQPIPPFSSVTFTYAWDKSFPFTLVSSQSNCS